MSVAIGEKVFKVKGQGHSKVRCSVNSYATSCDISILSGVIFLHEACQNIHNLNGH